MYTINDLILLFFIYSFVGWLWETVYCSSKEGHFVYRGFCLDRIARYTALQSVRCFFLRRNLPTISCCCFWSVLLFQPCSSILPVLFWKTSFISSFGTILNIRQRQRTHRPVHLIVLGHQHGCLDCFRSAARYALR